MGLYRGSIHKILVMPEKTGRLINVDHIDGNRLNNQKDNLRVCSHQENMRNKKTHKKRAKIISIYKGVFWEYGVEKWRAQIKADQGNRISIGLFSCDVAAANAYNYYAIKYFGEFALLNDCPYMEIAEWESYQSKKNKTSIYKGVSFVDGKWIAQICHEGKNIRIGSSDIEDEAAVLYNKRAIELKGEKAKINIILNSI